MATIESPAYERLAGVADAVARPGHRCLVDDMRCDKRMPPAWATGRKSTTRVKARSETSEPIAHDVTDGDCTNRFGEWVLNRFWVWRSGMKTFSNVANQVG